MDFEFYLSGIEDGILELLRAKMPGVKSFETYSGELDNPDALKAAMSSKARSYPLVMTSYADGVDVADPPTAAVLGRALHFRHDCTFVVIVVSTSARGENSRRRGEGGTLGTHSMISQVRDALTGLRLSKMVEGEKKLLTTEVLRPLSNEFISNMPNITAYAIPFTTSFKWSSPDRSGTGTQVTEYIVGVDGDESAVLPPEKPGVKYVVST